jgi:replication factor A1
VVSLNKSHIASFKDYEDDRKHVEVVIERKILNPDMKDLIIEGKIESIAEPRIVTIRAGGTAQVADVIISDESGSIKLALWDDRINSVKEGDNVTIEKGYTKEFRDEITLNIPKNGILKKH